MLKLFRSRPLESYVFLLIAIINVVPVFYVSYFVTLDGPAHLYNANLINTMIAGKSELVDQYLMFNPQAVPNWTGHLLLMAFNAVLPGVIAEKLFLCVFLIGLPFAFRSFIKAISPNNYLLSYLIFPFTYSFFLYLGFYNFLSGVLFMFITLAYWMNNSDRMNVLRFALLALLITATYFSHIYAFGIALIVITIHTIFRAVIEWTNGMFSKVFIATLRRSLWLVGASAVSLALLLIYLRSDRVMNHTYLPHDELVSYLKNLRPIISYNFEEEKYTLKLVYLLCALAVIAIYIRINGIRRPEGKNIGERIATFIRTNLRASDAWMLSFIVILIMYFKMPDSDGHAGYVSVRTAFLFFLFFIAWLATQPFPKWLVMISIAVSLWCSYKLLQYRKPFSKDLSIIAGELHEMHPHISDNSVILTLNHHHNWLFGHASNYLGADRPLLMLENYEAPTGFFPLLWNRAALPKTLLGDQMPAQSCMKAKWESNENNPVRVIDHVLISGDLSLLGDSCAMEVQSKLEQHYQMVHSTDNFKLYSLRKQTSVK